jgi:anti-sigma factor RsiW
VNGRIGPETLMRYLDGELPAEETRVLEAELARSTELQRELAIWRAMQRDVRGLSFAPVAPSQSVWGAVNRRVTRPVGWALLVAGVIAWLGYVGYLFALSPVSPWGKIAVAAIVIGFVLLLASVIADRVREWRTDPYRDIHR